MCGIAGWLDKNMDLNEKPELIKRMSLSLSRRGPDEEGIYLDKDAVLVNRRSVVTGKENEKQPMTVSHKGKIYTVVYDGELYNAEELRTELLQSGHSFLGKSDGEILLKSYLEWKQNCATKLNGIFAFAVYEKKSKTLFLCRDKIGVKPLFYYKYDGGILFGSEIKTLLASGIAKPVVTETGLYELLFLAPSRTMGNGVFKNIYELKPGECAVYKNDILVKSTYFSVTAKEHTDSENETIEKVRFLLTDAIEKRLVSGTPICSLLSGGLDSSIITKIASLHNEKHNLGPIHTYSVDYEDNTRYFKSSIFQPNSDAEFVDLMIADAGSDHQSVIINNSDLAEALYDSTIARDLPAMADIDSSLLIFCQQIKKSFSLALSGECSDELFGGYPWYHNKEILFKQSFPWAQNQLIRRSILKKGILPKGEEYVQEKYFDTINKTSKLKTDTPFASRMREMFMLNFNWFMQCLLDRTDRCAMYSGLNVRVPYCDYRIVEYSYNMPWEIKAYQNREKGILRKAFEDLLPKEICWRKKSPYPKTHNPVYMDIVSQKAKQILKKSTPIVQLLSAEKIENIISSPDDIPSPWYGQLMKAPQILAFIIQLDYWFEQYKVELEV